MTGTINSETGIDAFDGFMEYVRQKLKQDGVIMVPGALLAERFTLADLLRAIETASSRDRLATI
ncbi:MAG: hypothetical protein H6925_05195 [Holosporaceae bacterium]|nr:MAG: hypothetical protein H6925_05195 [Holosporaceae bacterium]